MGGFGSGRRYRWGTKRTAEGYCRLDVRYLQRAGYLVSGSVVSLTWRNGEGKQVASIQVVTAQEHLRLLYRYRRTGKDWKDVEETVPLVWISCHYGGKRP
jgi:hypothetical protein